jgi:polyisoprenoid-binding protein YceI
MRRLFSALVMTAVAGLGIFTGGARTSAADNYTVDGAHTSISFKIEHLGISQVHGRFNKFEGKLTIDKADAGKSSFTLSIKSESVDTGNENRDKHLRSPDYFDANQYAEMTFKSTAVKAVKGGYEVEGDFKLHGKSKKIKFELHGGKEVDNQGGGRRIGFITDLTLKRSDFGMVDKMPGALGDEVYVSIGLEATRK